MVEKGQKLSKMAKKNTNLDFEKTGKNNKQKKSRYGCGFTIMPRGNIYNY
jgi:hypothetical protein